MVSYEDAVANSDYETFRADSFRSIAGMTLMGILVVLGCLLVR